ncbi:hypothetical protein QTG54_008002 [Skeletonema marinoi]|uniref:Uncharacterized protein n=1 Tax=Skeletonema marinoi TaxID=267567 RepID=A0AAD9DD20_9STRA|nr:hypothetical protein QTG54_008002 [Skeletonema marinoi]
MKAAQTLTTAAALLCALPASVVALSKVETRNLDIAEDDVSRGLMHVTVDFKDECLHKHKDVCIAAINAKLAAYPELFEDREAFEFEVNKVREATDEGYNIVSMRLNVDETTVGGLLGDGMIWYPYEWCLAADDCYTVGPWDCDVGIPLLPEQCCKMIQDSVPHEDMNGKYLECYTEYPVGSPSNPVNPGRVCIHTDADGIVVHIPKNE